MPQQLFAFTSKYNGRVNVLKNEVQISKGFDPQRTSIPPALKKYLAVWDTGATGCVVSRKVVEELDLKPIGMTIVQTAGGRTTSPVYLVNIFLPNKVAFPRIKVTEGHLINSNVLIGMNIINQGDFAVSNKEGKTTFSFRFPSIECIDFVKQVQSKSTASVS